MFQKPTLRTIPLIDSSNVTNMDSMFEGNSSLRYFPKLDMGNVTSTNYMFGGCIKLAVLNLDHDSLATVISNSQAMFNGTGRECLQSEGADADGISYVYVKDAATQSAVLSSDWCPSTWSTANVVIR